MACKSSNELGNDVAASFDDESTSSGGSARKTVPVHPPVPGAAGGGRHGKELGFLRQHVPDPGLPG